WSVDARGPECAIRRPRDRSRPAAARRLDASGGRRMSPCESGADAGAVAPGMGRGKVLFVTNWYPTNEQPLRAPWVREHARAVRLYDDVAVLHCGEAGSELGRPYQMELRVDEAPEGRIPTYRVSYRSSAIPGVSYLTYVSV